ncbi:hypothetical protein B296_00044403 [Ensete ventricosum]|uniref:Uncharacterized protein n=1 Tax=Ensete ventricosum TaxID=4639 RepID=A0A426YYT0_ENSVE|nr:hypothetical protein B296_00044403 [Ensete ventricosum]
MKYHDISFYLRRPYIWIKLIFSRNSDSTHIYAGAVKDTWKEDTVGILYPDLLDVDIAVSEGDLLSHCWLLKKFTLLTQHMQPSVRAGIGIAAASRDDKIQLTLHLT